LGLLSKEEDDPGSYRDHDDSIDESDEERHGEGGESTTNKRKKSGVSLGIHASNDTG
jgi:hypothetical protein